MGGGRWAVIGLVVALLGLSGGTAHAFTQPPIRHVWVVNLENANFADTIGNPDHAPYLAGALKNEGVVIPQYFGTGHNSLDNYIAQVSGQSPTPASQGDFTVDPFPLPAPLDLHGQAVTQGSVYPSNVKTIGDQLAARGLTWKAYMEDVENDPYHNGACGTLSTGNFAESEYVSKHNGFVYFHSLIDDPASCARIVGLERLRTDLSSVATTPNVSFISPGIINDGHEDSPGQDYKTADNWLRYYMPVILNSPAFRQDGMLVVTTDEAESVVGVAGGPVDGVNPSGQGIAESTTAACCHEIPGPNSPMPGITGPGGGKVGALVISPFVKPGSMDAVPADPTGTAKGYYNHYSLLRTIEDIFHTQGGTDGDGHLGFAGTYLDYPGPGAFGCDVYTAYAPCHAGPEPAHQPLEGATPRGPLGPRRADGSTRWLGAGVGPADLNGVSCAAGAACVAVGAGGTLLRSEGDMTLWHAIDSGVNAQLAAIDCTDVHCMAVGSGGAVITSNDAGAHWARTPPAGDVDLAGVSCPNATTCFVVGTAGFIARTTDGGEHWTQLTSPTTLPLTGIACAHGDSGLAGQQCVVSGPWRDNTSLTNLAASTTVDLLATADGGATWQLVGSQARTRAVACPDTHRCVAGGDEGIVQNTEDGGTTWSYTNAQAEERIAAIGCASPDLCILAADDIHSFLESFGTVTHAYTTTDAGKTLTPHNLGTFQPIRSVACASADLCVAVGAVGTIVRSADRGSSWDAVAGAGAGPLAGVPCTTIGNPKCHMGAESALNAVDCTSAGECVGAGSRGILMQTADGFATTTSSSLDGGSASPLPTVSPTIVRGVSCTAATACVAVGQRGAAAFGDDAGWTRADSGTTSTLSAVSCQTGGRCVAVGDHGVVSRSGDGGQHWDAGDTGLAVDLNGIRCTDAHCVAVGSNGVAGTSDDGGRTWDAAATPTDAYLAAVDCWSASRCVAAGEGGTMLTSADGGRSWTASRSGVGDDLYGVSCDDSGACAAVGSHATALTSTDGGDHWVVRGTGADTTLRAVSCASAAPCVAGGDDGALLAVDPLA